MSWRSHTPLSAPLSFGRGMGLRGGGVVVFGFYMYLEDAGASAVGISWTL